MKRQLLARFWALYDRHRIETKPFVEVYNKIKGEALTANSLQSYRRVDRAFTDMISLDRVINLFNSLPNVKAHIFIEEDINPKIAAYLKGVSSNDKEHFLKTCLEVQQTCQVKDIESRLFLGNFINTYVIPIYKGESVTFILELKGYEKIKNTYEIIRK
jgi:hypothetical protein